VVALASRALAVVDAEQAAPLQKPRVGSGKHARER